VHLHLKMLPNDRISPLFEATAQATEAAITNTLLAADTMTGANDLRVYALPVDRMLAIRRLAFTAERISVSACAPQDCFSVLRCCSRRRP
jgi:hypothetical protein